MDDREQMFDIALSYRYSALQQPDIHPHSLLYVFENFFAQNSIK